MEQDGTPQGSDGPVTSVSSTVGTPPRALAVGAAQAARLCGVGRATWHTLRKGGRLPKPVHLGSRVLWRTDELRAWVEAGCPALSRWEAMKRGRWS